jgi:hypothetical protein
MIGEIIERYMPIADTELWIFCDNRHLKGMSKREFEQEIISHLVPLCPPTTRIEVEMIDSTTNPNIQIADWIAGALARYLRDHDAGSEYYRALRNNMLNDGIEFFADR